MRVSSILVLPLLLLLVAILTHQGAHALTLSTCQEITVDNEVFNVPYDLYDYDNEYCIYVGNVRNVIIDGNGHRAVGSLGSINVTHGHNITIRNFLFDNKPRAVLLVNAEDSHVELCTFNMNYGTPLALEINFSLNIEVNNCTFTGVTKACTLVKVYAYSQNINMHDNTFQTIHFDDSTDATLLDVHDVTTFAFKSNKISGVTITNSQYPGYLFHIFKFERVANFVLDSNLIESIDATNLDFKMWLFQAYDLHTTSVAVTNNKFTQITGVKVSGLDFVYTSTNLIVNVSGNTFDTFTALTGDGTGYMNLIKLNVSDMVLTFTNNKFLALSYISYPTISPVAADDQTVYGNTGMYDNGIILDMSKWYQCTGITNYYDYCYPPTLDCCNMCRQMTDCTGHYDTMYYETGECSAILEPCHSFKSGYNLTFQSFSSNVHAYYENKLELILTFSGLYTYIPTFAVFDGATKLNDRYISYDSVYGDRYHLGMPMPQDRMLALTFSFNGVYDPNQAVKYAIASNYQLTVETYASDTVLYIYWNEYNDGLVLISYTVEITFEDGRFVLKQDTTDPFFAFLTPVAGASYTIMAWPNYANSLSGFLGSKTVDFTPGPHSIAYGYGPTATETVSKMVYDSVKKVYYAVGNTNSTFYSSANYASGKDIFLLKIYPNFTIEPYLEAGEPGDDIILDAIVATDGYIYVLSENLISGYHLHKLGVESNGVPTVGVASILNKKPVALIEGPDQTLWIGGTKGNTPGIMAFVDVMFLANFSFSSSLSTTFSGTPFGIDTIVTDMIADRDLGVVYAVGYLNVTVGSDIFSGFVAQWTRNMLSSTPKIYSWRNRYNDGPNGGNPDQVVTQYADVDVSFRKKMAIANYERTTKETKVTYLSMDHSSGQIAGYYGCYAYPQITYGGELLVTMFVDHCRHYCATENTYIALLTGANICVCTNDYPLSSNALPEESCETSCHGDPTQRCGGSVAYGAFSVYTASGGGEISSIVPTQLPDGLLGGISFIPSSAVQLALYGTEDMGFGYYTIIDEWTLKQGNVTLKNGGLVTSGVVDPVSLNLVLGGSISQVGFDTAFIGGDSDVLISVIPKVDGITTSGSISWKKMGIWDAGITIFWDKPHSVANIYPITYSILKSPLGDGNDTEIYNNVDFYSYTYDNTSPDKYKFNAFYRVKATWAVGFVYTEYVSVPKMAQIKLPDAGEGASLCPLVIFDPVNKTYLMVYDIGSSDLFEATTFNQHSGAVTLFSSDPALVGTNARTAVVVNNTIFAAEWDVANIAQFADTHSYMILNYVDKVAGYAYGEAMTVWVAMLTVKGQKINLAVDQFDQFGTKLLSSQFGGLYYCNVIQDSYCDAFMVYYPTTKYLYAVVTGPDGNTLLKINTQEPTFDDAATQLTTVLPGYRIIGLFIYQDMLYIAASQYLGNALPYDYKVLLYDIGQEQSTLDGLSVSISESPATMHITRSLLAGGGMWRAKFVPNLRNTDDISIGLYYYDFFHEYLAYQVKLADDPGYATYALTSLATDGAGTLCVGAMLKGPYQFGGEGSYLALLIDETPFATTFEINLVYKNKVNLHWTVPGGVLPADAASLSFKIEYHNGNGDWKTGYTGASLISDVAGLAGSTTYHFRATANFGNHTVVYPEVVANTLSNHTIDGAPCTTLIDIPYTFYQTALDANNERVYMLFPQYFELLKFSGVNGDYIGSSTMAVPSDLMINDMAVLSDGTILLLCSSTLNTTLALCSFDFDTQDFGCFNWIKPANVSEDVIHIQAMTVLPNDDIWLVGQVIGHVPGFSAPNPGTDVFVAIVHETDPVQYIAQFGNHTKDYATSIVYNKDNGLVYCLMKPDTSLVNGKLIPYIATFNVSSKTLLSTQEINEDLGNGNYADLVDLTYDPYFGKLYILAGGAYGVVSKRELGIGQQPVVITVALDQFGLVTSSSSRALYDRRLAVEKVLADPDTGAFLVGDTILQIAGNVKLTSGTETFYGPAAGPLMQYGYSGSTNTHIRTAFMNPRTFYKSIITFLDRSPYPQVRVRIETSNVITTMSPLVIVGATNSTVTAEWKKIDGIPNNVLVSYEFTCSDSGGVFSREKVQSRDASGLYTCKFNAGATGLFINVSVSDFGPSSAKLGSGKSVVLFSNLVAPSVAQLTPVSASVEVKMAGTYTIQIGLDAGFGNIFQTLYNTNQTVNGLTPYVNYYFRTVAEYALDSSIKYYSDYTTVVLRAQASPPTLVWTSFNKIKLSWPAGAYTLTVWSGNKFINLTTAASPYVATGLTANTTYRFQMQLADQLGSVSSEVYKATTLAFPTIMLDTVTMTTAMVYWGFVNASQANYFISTSSDGGTSYTDVFPINTESGQTQLTNLVPGVTYFYKIKVVDKQPTSFSVGTSSFTTTAYTLSPPQVIFRTHYSISLNWTADPNTTKIVSEDHTLTYHEGIDTEFTMSGLQPDTQYKFVLSRSKSNVNFYSNPLVTATLAIPKLSFTEVKVDQFKVNWIKASPAEAVYTLQTSKAKQPFVDEVILSAESGSSTLFGQSQNTTVSCRVKISYPPPVNTVFYSDVFNVTTLTIGVPVAPSVVWVSHKSIAFNWTRDYDGTYVLQEVVNAKPVDLFSSANLVGSFIYRNLQPSTAYMFQITRVDGSNYTSFTQDARTLDVPVLTLDSANITSVTVSWGTLEGPSTYELQRSIANSSFQTIQPIVSGSSYSTTVMPNTEVSFRISIKDAEAALDTTTALSVRSLPLPTLSVADTNETDVTLAFGNIFSNMAYELQMSNPTFTTIALITANNTKKIDSLLPGTTYTFRIKITNYPTDLDSINATTTSPATPGPTSGPTPTPTPTPTSAPNNTNNNTVQKYQFSSSGYDTVFTTAVDSATGNTYSLGYTRLATNASENTNFVLQTTASGGLIGYVRYGTIDANPLVVSAAVVGSDSILRFTGSDDNGAQVCTLTGQTVSCTQLRSGNGVDTTIGLVQDTTSNIWVLGYTTGSFEPFPNFGQRDIFVAVVFPNTTVTYLQWGTPSIDTPTAIGLNTANMKIYIAGQTTGNFPGFMSNANSKNFVTDLVYNPIRFGNTIQWDSDGGVINGVSYDSAAGILTLTGSGGQSRKRATYSGFVSTFTVSANGTIFPDSLSTVSFGTGESTIYIIATTFNPTDGSVFVVGYNDTGSNDVGKEIIYYTITAGVVSQATSFGTADDDVPSAVVYNPSNQNMQIFGTVTPKTGASSVFVYSIPPPPVVYSAPQAPKFGAVSFTFIEVILLAPYIKVNNYTLMLVNNSNYVPLYTTGTQTRFVVSNLQSNTSYTFAVMMTGPSITNALYSTTATRRTSFVGCTNYYCDCASGQIRCANGLCVNSISECPMLQTSCIGENSFKCYNGTCVKSHLECVPPNANSNCTGTTCWDGSCVTGTTTCSNVPACPVLTKRCPDGSCSATCGAATNTCNSTSLCGDGSCPPCYNVYGCPKGLPTLCPSGKCTNNITQCSGNCSTNLYQCFDGTCKSNYSACDTPPRLHYPIPFSYILPQQNDTNKDGTLAVPIYSTALISIAHIYLPYALFTYANESSSEVLDVSPVADSDLYDVSGYKVWGNSTYGASIFSTVLSLSIPGYDTSNFSVSVKVVFNNSLPAGTNISNLCMAFVNRTSGEWECESIIQFVEGQLVGYTSHFTEFAVLLGTVTAPHVNTLDDDDFKKLKDVDKSTIGIYVLVGILVVYLAGLAYTIRVDRRHQRYIEMSGGASSRPHSIALTDMRGLQTVGSGDDEWVSTNSAPPTPTSVPSYLPPPTPPTASSPIFIRDKSGIRGEDGKKLNFLQLSLARLRIKHSWVAVGFCPAGYRLTRSNIWTVLLCMILGNLMMSATFYQDSDDTGVAQRFIVGIITALCVFPMITIISLAFRFTPRKYWYLAYVFAYLFCIAAMIVTLVFTLKFGTHKTQAWLTSIAISTTQDGIINQPLKLFLSSLVIVFYPSSSISAMLL